MAYHFSANQYEDAFVGKKLQNWTVPRKYKERPVTFEGYTQIVATDRGHLLAGVPRSKESPWGTFMGTWDMPLKIPPARLCSTARSKHGAENLRHFKDTSPLNEAANGYKPFRWDKAKKKTFKRLYSPPPSVAKSPTDIPQPSGLPASARITPRKSLSPVEAVGPSPGPGEANLVSSHRVTPRNVDAPPSRPHSKQATPVLSRGDSAASHTKLIDNNVRVSPTPSLRSDVLPDIVETGRPKSGASVRKSASPRITEKC